MGRKRRNGEGTWGTKTVNGHKYKFFRDSNGKYTYGKTEKQIKEKLEKQIKFMEENNYDFTFTGYEFADENGNNLGKVVNVPKQINYKQALKNTTIFTSTVIFNVEKLGKELISMPNVRRGQDTATWWKVLKTGIIAYGLNESLSLYRRSNNTLSSNKIKALKRTWNLYRNVEKLSFFTSLYNFCWYCLNAVKRRI